MADDGSTPPEKKRQEPPPIEFLKPGEVQQTPPPQPGPPAAWVTRPEDYQRAPYAPAPAPPRPAAGSGAIRAQIAAVLLISAAALSVASLLLASFPPPSVQQYQAFTNDSSLYAISQVCNLFVIWAQAIMVIGGIMAWQRMNWRMTVACSFFSMFLISGYALAVLDLIMLLAAGVGIAGFVLAVMAREDFVS